MLAIGFVLVEVLALSVEVVPLGFLEACSSIAETAPVEQV
jgi:hypothetical protein